MASYLLSAFLFTLLVFVVAFILAWLLFRWLLRDYQHEHEQTKQLLQETETNYDQLASEKVKLTNTYEQLGLQLLTVQKESKKHLRTNDSLQKRLDEQGHQIHLLSPFKTKFEATDQEYKQAVDELADVHERLKKCAADKDNLQKTIGAKDKEIGKQKALIIDLTAIKEQYDILVPKSKKMELDIVGLNTQLIGAQQQADRTTQQLQSTEAHFGQLNKRLASADKTNREILAKYNTSQKTNTAHKKTITFLKGIQSSYTALLPKYDEAKAQLQIPQTDYESLQLQYQGLQAGKEQLDTQYQNLQADNENWRRQYADLNHQLGQIEITNEQLNEQLTHFRSFRDQFQDAQITIQTLTTNIDQLVEENNALGHLKLSLNEELKQERQFNHDQKQQISALKQDKKDLHTNNTNLVDAKQNVEQQVANLTDKLEQTDQTLNDQAITITTLNDFKTSYETIRSENGALHLQIEALNQNINELETKNAQFKIDLDKQINSNQLYLSKNTTLSSLYDHLVPQKEALGLKVNQLNDSNKTLTQDKFNLTEQITDLQHRLAQAKQEALQSENALCDDLAQLTQTKEQLANNLETLEATSNEQIEWMYETNRDLQKAHIDLTNQMQLLNQTNNDLHQQIDLLNTQLATSNQTWTAKEADYIQQVGWMHATNSDLEKGSTALMKDLAIVNHSLEDTNQQLMATVAERDQYIVDITELNMKLKELYNIKVGLDITVERLSGDKDGLQEEKTALEQEIAQLQEELTALNTAFAQKEAALQQQMELIQATNRDLEQGSFTLMQELDTTKSSLTHTINNLTTDYTLVDQARTTLSQEKETALAQLGALDKQVDLLHATNKDLEQGHRALNNQVDALQAKIEEQMLSAQEKQALFDDQRQELVNNIADVQYQLEEAKKASEEQATSLTNQLELTQATNVDLERGNATLNEQLTGLQAELNENLDSLALTKSNFDTTKADLSQELTTAQTTLASVEQAATEKEAAWDTQLVLLYETNRDLEKGSIVLANELTDVKAQLTNATETLNTEKATLATEKETLVQQLTDAQTALTNAQETATATTTELTETIHGLTTDKAALTQQLTDTQTKAAETAQALTADKATLTTDKDALTQQLADTKATLANTQETTTTTANELAATIAELTTDKAALTTDKDALTQQLADTQTALTDAQQDTANKETTWNDQLSLMYETNRDLEKGSTGLTHQLTNLQTQLTDTVSTLTGDKDTLAQQLADIQAELAQTKIAANETEDNLNAEKETLAQQLADAKTAADETEQTLTTDKENLAQQLADAKTAADETEQTLTTDKENLAQQLADAKTAADETEQTLTVAKEVLAAEKATIAQQLTDAQQAAADQEASWNDQLDLMYETNRDLEKGSTALTSQLTTLQNQLTEEKVVLEQQVADTQARLRDAKVAADETAQALTTDKNALTTEKADLTQQLRNIETALAEQGQTVSTLQNNRDQLTVENTNLNEELTDLRQQLIRLQDNLGTKGMELERQITIVESLQAAALSALKQTSNPKQQTQTEQKEELLEEIKKKAADVNYDRIGTATADEKDALHQIKGIGDFSETKLNALGIYTFRQIANFTPADIDLVTDAIRFFPGRIDRDQWVEQAKGLYGEGWQIQPRSAKAQKLQEISEKAGLIDFDRIGTASADQKDDLQRIKGIGPFIEAKLNALGIYTFQQLANLTEEDADLVNKAIEFFSGRIKRDAWVAQAAHFVQEQEQK